MRRTKFTEEQIAFALKQAETGTPVMEVIRKMGITEQTFYRWKKKYGGLGNSELRRLKQLEEENKKLELEIARLKTPERISSIAVSDLEMVRSPDTKVITLEKQNDEE